MGPVIGIDIGGSKIRGILWVEKKAARWRQFATPKNIGDFRETLVALTGWLEGRRGAPAIGIGAAGIVDRTTLLSSPNIPYIRDFEFRSLWPRSTPLRLDNDARSFGRAEHLRGAGRGAESIFALTIGTGIGRAYGKDGKISRLKKFEHPEPWEREYQVLRDARDDAALAKFLGEKLSLLMKPSGPQRIILGGGVMERPGLLRGLGRELAFHGLEAEVRRARFRKNAVAIGAALLFSGRR